MHASTTGMETTRAVLLVLGLLCLTCLASGLSETKADQSGTFSVEDYSDWLENHTINVGNYVAEVGMDVAILSPISPPPIGMKWFSLNFDGELRPPVGRAVGRVGSTNSEKFLETYNTSWQSVFQFDKQNRWLRIRKVHLGYADLFRVFVGGNGTEETAGRGSEESQAFDVAITLMTFEKHECGFTSKPQNPKAGDTLILSCSVIVNGMWNAYLIFRNNYDKSEIIGETKACGIQRSLGSKICSSVRVKAETVILAYSCRLEFPSDGRHVPNKPMFLSSKWTAVFNKELVCNLPKIYLEAIPSNVTLLCNNMPCEETVVVNDTVTCVAHGYPQPVFDLRVRDVSAKTGNNSESQGVDYENRFFMDTDEEKRDDGFGGDYSKDTTEVEIKGHEDFRIGPTNVGHIEITCNVSNALGWGYNSLVLEVKLNSLPPMHDIQLVCNDKPCENFINVGDVFSVRYYVSYDRDPFQLSACKLWIDNSTRSSGPQCNYTWSVEDVGQKLIRLETTGFFGTEIWERNITVVAERATETTLIDVEVAEADGKWLMQQPGGHSLQVLCNEESCRKFMIVGEAIYVKYNVPNDPKHLFQISGCQLRLDNSIRECGPQCNYIWSVQDIGPKSINFIITGFFGTETWGVDGTIVPGNLGDYNILCNYMPCLENGLMKVGDKVSIYVDVRKLEVTISLTFKFADKFCSIKSSIFKWYYTLDVKDTGSKLVQLRIYNNLRNDVMEKNIIVLSDQIVSIDMLCNSKFCQDNEIMRFGDEISCYFEPRVILDEMTFTLLIDNYVKVEGYPCTYALKEEDVGTKWIECRAIGTVGTYKRTRNINTTCAIRDKVVLKPSKKIHNARLDNVTDPSGVVILCGDEPCVKPGRTIYTGTYVCCRMNDGQKTTLNFMVNGKLISKPMPDIRSEICYKLTANDTGASQAICSGTGTVINFVNATDANFTVHAWPCPDDVVPASADMFEYENAADEIDSSGRTESPEHGDAAGAIDRDQEENIDSGAPAGNKGVPKWNDDGESKSKPNIGSGRESFVLLQLFLAFIAAFVGLGQF